MAIAGPIPTRGTTRSNANGSADTQTATASITVVASRRDRPPTARIIEDSASTPVRPAFRNLLPPQESARAVPEMVPDRASVKSRHSEKSTAKDPVAT